MSKFRGWSDPRNLIPAKFNPLKVLLQENVNAALKLLDQQESSGILPLSDDVFR